MRWRRRPGGSAGSGRSRGSGAASATFAIVVVFAVGALAWGATHSRSAGHGLGSVDQQAAARTALLTGLTLPTGLAIDRTSTACGEPSDACLTGNTNVTGTLVSLRAVLHAAGGSLDQVCGTAAPAPNPGGVDSAAAPPRFTCAVGGRLDGASLVVLLGDGWLLPGHPTPRTAVLIDVPVATADLPAVVHAALPSAAPSAGLLLPAGWASAPQPCGTATLAAGQSVLPPCSPHSTTLTISAALAPAAAGSELSASALAQGFRLDGRPCVPDTAFQGCQVWGERVTGTTTSTRVQHTMVALLRDDGQGHTTGTLTLADQS
jgi:hypothetical protein